MKELNIGRITWPGSTDEINIFKVNEHNWYVSNELANTLTSRYPNFHPMKDGKSVDQHFAWMALQGDIYNVGGVRLIARHTANKENPIIAVIMSMNRPKPNQALLVVQTLGSYAADDVDPLMLKLLKSENVEMGRRLGVINEDGDFELI